VENMPNIELLKKNLWSLSDIQNYFGIGKTKASQMMQEAKRISASKYCPSKAKMDVLLKLNDTSLEAEIKNFKILEAIA
jgi:hypothetical protein